MSERLLTKSEVSARTGVPVATLEHWRATGKGPRGVRIGSRVRYREADLDEWIRAQFEDPQPVTGAIEIAAG